MIYVGVFQMMLDGVTFYFIDNEYYFSGDKIYEDGSVGSGEICLLQ